MRIQMVDIAKCHEYLKKSHLLDSERQEDFFLNVKDGDLDSIRIARFQYSPVELPFPLSYAKLEIKRMGELYAARFLVSARDCIVYASMREAFPSLLKEHGLRLVLTSRDTTGYVLSDEESKPVVAISAGSNEPNVRVLGFGTGGSQSRRFGEILGFKKDMHKLEQVANDFIESCFPADKFRNIDLEMTPV
jgi:hypothetical protein